jgi:hypothetical protein
LGVVDDTCDARVEISLAIPGAGSEPAPALVTILVGPPDFGPDRRPFVSIADDLNDRSASSADRNAAMSDEDVEAWVQDLFQRAYETVSLMNVDLWRSRRAAQLSGRQLAPQTIPGDGVSQPDHALGGRDVLRNHAITITAPMDDRPLPIFERARERHRSVSDLDQLKVLLSQDNQRLRHLVRPPFWAEQGEDLGSTTMRMPPFMRASNANPLTLTGWQYDLLMRWNATVTAPPVLMAAVAPAEGAISEDATTRQLAVLARLA